MAKPTVCSQIIDYLIEIIENNSGDPGFKLPGEESLAIKFDVSRKPVRAAYLNLIERGYVKSRQGKGYFIAKQLDTKPVSVFKNICFITPSIKSGFMKKIISGMQDFCEKQRLNLLIMVSDQNIKKEKHLLQSLPMSNVKGAIVFPVDNEFYNEELLRLSLNKFPIVIIDRFLKALNIAYVATDNYNTMLDAVQLLHSKKLTEIVYITPPASLASSIDERARGFRQGLNKYYGMIKADNLLEIKPDDLEAQKKTMVDYLKRRPDTEVVISSGVQATAVIGAAAELNIPIPQKLKLVIFDSELSDTEKMSVQPYIIEQDGYGIGYEAGAALYNQIYGDLRIIIKRLPVKIIDYSTPPPVGKPVKPKAARR